MDTSIVLSPTELYFMASFMGAKYIDYTYIAAMEDIEQNYTVKKHEAQARLTALGLIDEDFSGTITILPMAKDLLTPVFFGEREASIDISHVTGGDKLLELHRIHYHDGNMVHISLENMQFKIEQMAREELTALAETIVSEDYPTVEEKTVQLDETMISRLIAVKKAIIGGDSTVLVFAESDGIIYYEVPSRQFRALARDEFVSTVKKLIREE